MALQNRNVDPQAFFVVGTVSSIFHDEFVLADGIVLPLSRRIINEDRRKAEKRKGGEKGYSQ